MSLPGITGAVAAILFIFKVIIHVRIMLFRNEKATTVKTGYTSDWRIVLPISRHSDDPINIQRLRVLGNVCYVGAIIGVTLFLIAFNNGNWSMRVE